MKQMPSSFLSSLTATRGRVSREIWVSGAFVPDVKVSNLDTLRPVNQYDDIREKPMSRKPCVQHWLASVEHMAFLTSVQTSVSRLASVEHMAFLTSVLPNIIVLLRQSL